MSLLMLPQASRDAAGSRRYRTTLALIFGDDAAEDELLGVLRRLDTFIRPERVVSVSALYQQPGWLELELQLRSSEADDHHDVGAVREMQLDGDRAAAYWTRPAATLADATIAAVEFIQRAVGVQPHEEAVDALVLRTVPLGDPSRRADLSVLPPPPRGAPVIHLHGIPAQHGAQLASVIRDELDEQRWGPADRRLPVVGYDAQRRSAIVTYPPVDPERRHASRIFDALGDTAAALGHLQQVLDRIGAIGGSCIETRIDPAPVPAPPLH